MNPAPTTPLWKTLLEVAAIASTLGLFAVGICQFRTMQKTVKVENRAWMNFVLTGGPKIQVAGQNSVPLQLVNIGKTPARNVTGLFVAQKIILGHDPNFAYMHGAKLPKVGAIFPNDTMDIAAPVYDENYEATSITSGDFYVAIFGTVEYDDSFGQRHWVHRCFPVTYGGSSLECIKYNDTDSQ